MGEALPGVGWSASQPGDLRENRRGEKNKTHTLKTGTEKPLQWKRAQTTYWTGSESEPQGEGAQHGSQERWPGSHIRQIQEPSIQQQNSSITAQPVGNLLPIQHEERREALTMVEAMVERPRGRTRDDSILGNPCFGRGLGAEGNHMEGKLGDDPEGVGIHGSGQLRAAGLVGRRQQI